jgi:DNA-binding CsgD family transcriptional regulator
LAHFSPDSTPKSNKKQPAWQLLQLHIAGMDVVDSQELPPRARGDDTAHGVTHAALAALERLHFGVLLLGPQAELRHATRRAHEIGRRTLAFSIDSGGRLQASAPSLSTKLHRAIHGAASGGTVHHHGTALLLRGTAGADVHAVVMPMPSSPLVPDTSVAATVFVTDPEATLPNFARKLRQIYMLSPSEAQLAEALVHGKSLKVFAEERGTTLNTVRTQLKTMAAKVGAKRQVDLVRCILTGPAVLDL